MKRIETTLLILKREDEILLAEKKRGFGVGKFNGVGGKLKPGESIEEAMLRETYEEIQIKPMDHHYVGKIDFIESVNGERQNVIMHIFSATNWEGEITETEEMRPEWFKIDKIPYDKMFQDDKFWMPYFLEGTDFDAHFEFDENWNIIDQKITRKVEEKI